MNLDNKKYLTAREVSLKYKYTSGALRDFKQQGLVRYKKQGLNLCLYLEEDIANIERDRSMRLAQSLKREEMKLNEYLKVKEAADFLGVNPNTLRIWEKQGKIKSVRNPMNKYRLYVKEDLEKVLKLLRSEI